MGNPTGFMKVARQTSTELPPKERIANFNEFHVPLHRDEQQLQGARCMDCGVPFCQSGMMIGGMASGCPLNNLIPEWNDLVYQGRWELALQRLMATNRFPEFTGRVCPAPCEAACLCGLGDAPVSIRDNELAIIESGYAGGWMQPHPPAVRTEKRVAVVGSGPSGLACAAQLNSRGHSVTVFERAGRPGGLLMYGIPNMKLEKWVIDRRVKILEEEGIEFVLGADVGRTVSAEELEAQYDAVVLCCGAANPRDLSVPGREGEGVWFAVDFLKETTRSLLDNGLQEGTYPSARGKHVVIVGGGDTGNDCVGTCIRHGCESVTQLEMMPKAPDSRGENNPWPEGPRVCKPDYGGEEAIAACGPAPRVSETPVSRLIRDEGGALTAVETVRLGPDHKPLPGTEQTLPCELLLIAAGFLGPQDYVPEAFGLARTARSNVQTAEGGYDTGVAGVFAAGDMRRGQSLVVWAIQEGRAAARQVDEYLMGYTNLE